MKLHVTRWILFPCLALTAVAALNYQFWISNQVVRDSVMLPTLNAGGIPVALSRSSSNDPLEDIEVTWRVHLSPDALAAVAGIDLAFGEQGATSSTIPWTTVPLGAQDQLQVTLVSPEPGNPPKAKALHLRVTSPEGKQDIASWSLGATDR